MLILNTDQYSHKGGLEYLQEHHGDELQDIMDAVATVDAVVCLRKQTEEATKPPLLYSPEAMNYYLKLQLHERGWTQKSNNPKAKKKYSEPRITFTGHPGSFREMDGIKNRVGVEIQFGKYAFMGYDIFSKMVMFNKRGEIDCGIELVCSHSIIRDVSSGVSSFNQIVLDMETRGEADIDIPTLVLGISITDDEKEGVRAKRERFKTEAEAMIAAGEVAPKRGGGKPGPKGGPAIDMDEAEAEEAAAEEEEQDQE